MAMVTAGTAKNGVLIVRPVNLDGSWNPMNVNMRGTSYQFRAYYNSEDDEGATQLVMGSTVLAGNRHMPTIGYYCRFTLSDSSIKVEVFDTQPPVTGGTPLRGYTLSATDSNYLISGTWQYDASYYLLVSFTSNDGANVPVTGVTLNKSSQTIDKGGAYTLVATVSPSNATNSAVSWSSSNTAVATVSSGGVVTAVAAGTATIMATTADGGFTATCAITVVIAVTSISVQTRLMLIKPNTSTLTATVLPSDATNKTVTWSSSNTSIATVDSNGVVTPVSVGSATITATTSNGKTSSCSVEVFGVITATRAPYYKYTISAADTILAGDYIFGDSTDVTNLFDTWSDGNLTYVQTANGIGWVKTSGVGMIHPWLAFNKYHDYAVEVEFYSNSAAHGPTDTALVWYPNEYRYAHLPKPYSDVYSGSDSRMGFVFRSASANSIEWVPPTIPWYNTSDKWIKLRHDYRYADGKGYIKGSVTIDGVTKTSAEVMVDDVVKFPNPTVTPTVWSMPTDSIIAYRNLKVVSGALSAYSLLFGNELVYTTKANGTTWQFISAVGGTAHYSRDNLVFDLITDGSSNVHGTGTLTVPTIRIPVSSNFDKFEVRTTIAAGEGIVYNIKDDSGNVKKTGNFVDGYNSVDLSLLTDKSLTFELVFTGGKITLLDVSWTTPTAHTVSYNANGGTGTIASQTGFEFTLASAGFTNGDYKLAGWNTAADGSGTFYALGAAASFMCDTTLYAVWSTGLPLYIGSQQVQKVYVGNNEVIHMYLGSTKIY